MEIKCKVHEVGPVTQVTDSFKKRDLIVEYAENPQYPEYIKFEAHQDKVSKFDELRAGDEITLHFNLRGRPWTDRNGKTAYFNTLVVWKLDINRTVSQTYGPPAGQQPQQQYAPPAQQQYQAPPQQQYAPPTQQQQAYQPPAQQGFTTDPGDDLPF